MSELDKLRLEINNIDNNIMDLLSERMKVSSKVGEYKRKNNMEVYDSTREKKLIERLINYNNMDEEFIKDLWNTIMKYSKDVQNN
jgi:monofunctional chorismate mutase